ncbi:ferredoxin [Pseudonocardia parietis]|uniref:Ferredoxin n=1 Tax=Pseudonocardia parietis TaxID=570936 RepID=A0ABS4VQZ6_9PSEU|nr:ferredoxin [Pseudonocardia parietis]MBP2366191.1 ferredoxin [Pseudonocardia parietis]
MRVEIDRPACAGHGQCSATAPEVYELDDDGFVLPVEAVPPGTEDDAHAGAAACPEQAIRIVG